MKNFIDPRSNIVLAQAEIPDHYVIGGALNQNWQHERVPFTYSIHAIDQESGALMFVMSEEMWTDVRNALLKQGLKMVPNYVMDGLRDFIEPLDYLNRFAESMFGSPLKAIARADLPSINSLNKQDSYRSMMNEYNTYFMYETNAGAPTKANNSVYDGVLMMYEGTRDNVPYTVLAGMDYKGVEYYTTLNQMLGNIGGLFGAMLGSAQSNEQGSNIFGHGKPCDAVEWGSEARYILAVPTANKDTAINDFVQLIRTYRMDASLKQRFNELKAQKAAAAYQTSLQYQSMAQQSQRNLQYQQQKLARQLAQNSAQISAGLMDSWDKKMASDSRISQNYSEAIRGVNTYQTTDGRNVEVGVTADHVYENRYGDVYGVSGSAPDDETLNKLNWTEIHKK